MKNFGALLTLLLTNVYCAHAALVDIKTSVAVATCTGAGSTCNVTINAVGDVILFDVQGHPVQDLGSPTGTKAITLDLPQVPGTAKLYSVVPRTGDLAGKRVYLLIRKVPQRPGTRRADKNVFVFSRQLEGDKKDRWMEVGDIALDKKQSLTRWPFVVEQNGTFVTFSAPHMGTVPSITVDTNKPLPQGVKKVTFLVGKKI